jgi:Fic family protein
MKLPVAPPSLDEIFSGLSAQQIRLIASSAIGPAPDGQYRHWDTFRHVAPPHGWDMETAWAAVKLARRSLYQVLPLRDKNGEPFKVALPAPALEYLHGIDRDAAGSIQVSEQVTNPQTRDTYLVKSLAEEAITSSQLEGASTTRAVAKDLLRTGREPRDRSERMIANNYAAMQYIRSLGTSDLTPAAVLELQRIVTDGALDEPDASGRLRRTDEPIVISDERGTTLHTPPGARELEKRMRDMCAFANGTSDTAFVHPAVRAIVLHFWLAYDHPFVDGNGRTARALFYWAMARGGYWLAEFTSISRILKQARAKYSAAFLYSETDDNDLTYFLLHQLKTFKRAVDELHRFLADKQTQIQQADEAVRKNLRLRAELNSRQLGLIAHALRTPGATYTIVTHRRSHGIVYETARTDLLELEKRGILSMSRSGREFVFTPSPNLQALVSTQAVKP